ncbi:hypothetical protein AWC38_SpisGene17985 [Stylophora pistillata]|uniref:Uncharacterized protein n=1 Tax=Stylophora pistillata TaxID=50429 RepID=A0A2B4RME3_STYPI|nr:hypothetical protein AWC38_SpisGene17985 [Stylophora pistillata]
MKIPNTSKVNWIRNLSNDNDNVDALIHSIDTTDEVTDPSSRYSEISSDNINDKREIDKSVLKGLMAASRKHLSWEDPEVQVKKIEQLLRRRKCLSSTILNILLESPEELILKHKPSAIREDKIFTLDMREIPISSAEADDNGAYISKGNAKRLFQYNADGSRIVHNENGTYYANVKTAKGYRRDYVPDTEVFELTRFYRASKWNPTFARTIATVKEIKEKELKPYYLVIYKWTEGEKEFVTQRHGNAKKPTSSSYFRKEPEVFSTIDNLLDKGMSTDKICGEMANRNTDTHEGLISERNANKHPEFPGPSFWHFRKSRETYRSFAGELLIQKPEFSGTQKIGHDLDKAIAREMTDVFQDAKNVWYTQHIKERDLHHLKSIGANEKTQKRILTDIYGCQQDILQQDGLADSDDEEDFDAKLQSLRPIWETLAPGFHSWFIKHSISSRKSVSERTKGGRRSFFYAGEVDQQVLCRRREGPKGNGQIPPGYDQFKVDPVTWNKWGPERQSQHLNAFRNFVPKSFNMYKRPSSAGLKGSPSNKARRANLPEPEVFADRVNAAASHAYSSAKPTAQSAAQPKTVTPVQKSTSNNKNAAVNFLDLDRISGKQYELVSRDDNKLCPRAVQRCKQCRVSFNQADIVLVKSVGVRERTDKSGKVVRYTGNVYFHFLTKCLKEYDQKFEFSAITVPSRTLQFLSDGGKAMLQAKGLHVESLTSASSVYGHCIHVEATEKLMESFDRENNVTPSLTRDIYSHDYTYQDICDGKVEFDGSELTLLNMGSYIISHEVLRNFMFHFLKGRCTLFTYYSVWQEIMADANVLDFKGLLSYPHWHFAWHRDRAYVAEKHVRPMVDQVGGDVSKVTDTVMTSLHLELQHCAPALGSFLSWCISFNGSDFPFPTPIAGLFIALGKASLTCALLPQLDSLETFYRRLIGNEPVKQCPKDMLLLQQTSPLLFDIVSIVESDQLPAALTTFKLLTCWKKQSLLSAEMDQ